MKLYSLTDFPDDAIVPFTPEMVDSLVSQLADTGVTRMINYFYDYGFLFHTDSAHWETQRKTAEQMPDFERVIASTAKKYGLEAASVVKIQEQGIWTVDAPYGDSKIERGLDHIGGKICGISDFVLQHPELRIKRRSYDLDPDAINKTVTAIKLYKQNDASIRFSKKDITIYTSPDNTYYKPYTGDFTLTESIETAAESTVLSKTVPDYDTELLTLKGAPIRVLTIGGLSITDRYIAVGVKCEGECDPLTRFYNTPCRGIAIFDENGDKIAATPGGTKRANSFRKPHIEAGFCFDDGFGVYQALELDPSEGEGYFAIAKGKNEYVHGALCECEPAVKEYWLRLYEAAMDAGYDIIGTRIEGHSNHVDEPFAYGYNDCIKAEYFRRYGNCSEEEMELDKIAKIRGDAYTEVLIEAAKRVRARGKKFILTLNIEMLHDSIPLDRRYAYPMNVEWQWERWIEEIKPDEINFRMYYNSVKFLLSDLQCIKMLEMAKEQGVPLTVERYVYFDFLSEYKQLRDTGLFDAMTMYETAALLRGSEDGSVLPYRFGVNLLPEMKKIMKK